MRWIPPFTNPGNIDTGGIYTVPIPLHNPPFFPHRRDTVVVFDCPDKHTLCLDCFVEYCEVQLTDRQFEEHPDAGYTLRCPAKCEGSEIKESHHFRIMGPEKVYTVPGILAVKNLVIFLQMLLAKFQFGSATYSRACVA